MLTNFKESVGRWIYAQEDSLPEIPVGRIYDFVINPKNFKIEAFWVKALDGPRILFPKDVIHWNQKEILIKNEHDFLDPQEALSLRKIFNEEVRIIGAPVFGKVSGHYLGRVKNFAFHTIAPAVLNIKVEQGFLFWMRRRIIPQSRIFQVNAQGIWVSDQALEMGKVLENIPQTNPLPKSEGV